MTKKKTSKNHSAQVLSPGRRVLFRPKRSQYVRKQIPDKGCVFCHTDSEGAQAKSLCVIQTAHSMAIVNKFPYNSGHLLVLPRRHCSDLLELSQEEYFDLQNLVRDCLQALQEIYCPAGVNLGMNHGAAAGAGIPQHLHYHLVPRWAGDLNFFPLIAQTKVVIETPEQSLKKYRKYFKTKRSSK